ncbi:MAG: SpoIIE family protein phosphatase, partial [Opitutaceae bacterium]
MTSTPIPVLIVDDDPSVGAWLQLLVRRMGNSLPCDVKWITSGTNTIDELMAGNYDLVLLDYRLKDTDGLSVLSSIQALPREHRPEVIMLTGGGSEEIAVESMKRGARDYLVKGSLDQSTMRRAMSGALDHRRLEQQLARSNEELRSKNAQMEAELVMAREVQQALLPQQYPVFPRGAAPEASKLRFAHRWIPSSGMAGDFFEVLPVSDEIAGVFLCDVMGHGVRAALVTALIRGLMEEMMPYANDPGAFLRELNNHLKMILQRSDNVLFATAIYLVADVASGELRMANAGHPNPILMRKADAKALYWQGEGGPDPALGLISDVDYATYTVKVSSGDSVLLYTDGLYEAENNAGDDFGLKRLEEAVQ